MSRRSATEPRRGELSSVERARFDLALASGLRVLDALGAGLDPDALGGDARTFAVSLQATLRMVCAVDVQPRASADYRRVVQKGLLGALTLARAFEVVTGDEGTPPGELLHRVRAIEALGQFLVRGVIALDAPSPPPPWRRRVAHFVRAMGSTSTGLTDLAAALGVAAPSVARALARAHVAPAMGSA